MHLEGYKTSFSHRRREDSGFEFYAQVLEDIGYFVFSVTGASRFRIGNHERRWKVGL